MIENNFNKLTTNISFSILYLKLFMISINDVDKLQTKLFFSKIIKYYYYIPKYLYLFRLDVL